MEENGQKNSHFLWCSSIVGGQQGRNRSGIGLNVFLSPGNLYIATFPPTYFQSFEISQRSRNISVKLKGSSLFSSNCFQ